MCLADAGMRNYLQLSPVPHENLMPVMCSQQRCAFQHLERECRDQSRVSHLLHACLEALQCDIANVSSKKKQSHHHGTVDGTIRILGT